MSETPWYDDVVLPVLLAEARKVYGSAIRDALQAEGFDDMPRLGARVLGWMNRSGANLADVSGETGISKQGASQLIDVLVTRGYVERVPDPIDRRRMTVGLTDRGRAAADVVRSAVESVDANFLRIAGADGVATVRRTLGQLVRSSRP